MKSVTQSKGLAHPSPNSFLCNRVTVSKVTGFSAYFLLHGIHPVLPFDLADATFLVEGFKTGMSSVDLLVLWMRQLERRQEDIDAAAKALAKSRFKSKEDFEWKYRKRLRRNFISQEN